MQLAAGIAKRPDVINIHDKQGGKFHTVSYNYVQFLYHLKVKKKVLK